MLTSAIYTANGLQLNMARCFCDLTAQEQLSLAWLALDWKPIPGNRIGPGGGQGTGAVGR